MTIHNFERSGVFTNSYFKVTVLSICGESDIMLLKKKSAFYLWKCYRWKYVFLCGDSYFEQWRGSSNHDFTIKFSLGFFQQYAFIRKKEKKMDALYLSLKIILLEKSFFVCRGSKKNFVAQTVILNNERNPLLKNSRKHFSMSVLKVCFYSSKDKGALCFWNEYFSKKDFSWAVRNLWRSGEFSN